MPPFFPVYVSLLRPPEIFFSILFSQNFTFDINLWIAVNLIMICLLYVRRFLQVTPFLVIPQPRKSLNFRRLWNTGTCFLHSTRTKRLNWFSRQLILMSKTTTAKKKSIQFKDFNFICLRSGDLKISSKKMRLAI